MKISKVRIEFDNGGMLDFQYPGGFSITDVPKMLNVSPESLVSADKGTWQHALFGFLNIGFNVLLKRFGL